MVGDPQGFHDVFNSPYSGIRIEEINSKKTHFGVHCFVIA